MHATCRVTSFKPSLQALKDGYQLELPDIWLQNGNPWEVPRPEITYKINFYGSVKDGKWKPDEAVSTSLVACNPGSPMS